MTIRPETRRILADSLEALVEVKPFEKISVQDIIHYCGASRTTFYRYFKDKYDLMNWICKSQMDAILQDNKKEHRSILEIVSFIKEKRRYFQEIIQFKGQNSFVEFLLEYGQKACIDLIRRQLGPDDIPDEVACSVRMFIGGTTYLLYYWICNHCVESPDFIEAAILSNLPQNLRPYLIYLSE